MVQGKAQIGDRRFPICDFNRPPAIADRQGGRGARLQGVHRAWALVVALSLAGPGCHRPSYYQKDADREVYAILAAKQAKVLGKKASFTIEPVRQRPLDRLRGGEAAEPSPSKLSPGAELDLSRIEDGLPKREGAIRLSLRDALGLAVRYSRTYQSKKEDLYSSALTLTLQRFLWTPQWTGKLSAKETDKAGDKSVEEHSNFSVGQLFALGGKATVGLATDVLRFTTGDPRRSATSLLTADVVQPLWRGAGRTVAQENLTQAERNTVYAVRTLARFQKTFCVDITGRYYRVLQQRDAARNEWDNYQRILQSRERTEAMAKAGRLPEFQVDQARQDELSARNSWIQALRLYQDQLDSFKIDLSLPTDAPVELDPAEIDRLREGGLHGVALSADKAIDIALSRRLDLLTVVDQVADAERKIELARNGLAPDVNVGLTASVPSEAPTQATRLRPSQGTYTAGLDVDLPLRRKTERNAYRQTLIDLEQARRSMDELRDQVKLSVRGDWRALQEAAESYRIQRASVELAQRRVESTNLLLQRGTASARDVLEANAALVAAQNALTRALIDHTLARLAFWRDTELLQVGDDGVWQEVTDVPK